MQVLQGHFLGQALEHVDGLLQCELLPLIVRELEQLLELSRDVGVEVRPRGSPERLRIYGAHNGRESVHGVA